MSRKSTINTLFAQRGETSKSAVAAPDRVKTGAISAMGSSLKQLTESARAASRLQEQISAGAVVLDIEPEKIDASPVADRIATEVDPSFDELVESFRTSGQQVPILVRSTENGRYQIAYGHRRVRAALKLGLKVKALVKDLTDGELVVAQGKENLERKDLSFIERAQFARRLEVQGFDRSVILAALSTDKGDLSRYLSVASAIPEHIVQAIGPAPKVGRPRWLALAEKLAGGLGSVDVAIKQPEFKELGSDERFAAVFKTISHPVIQETSWTCDKAARIDRRGDRTILTFDDRKAPNFAAFLLDRLDGLYREFGERKESKGKL